VTFSDWLSTPTPYVLLGFAVVVLVGTALGERTDRLRAERDARIAERRARLAERRVR
jgi:hypothetical protein